MFSGAKLVPDNSGIPLTTLARKQPLRKSPGYQYNLIWMPPIDKDRSRYALIFSISAQVGRSELITLGCVGSK